MIASGRQIAAGRALLGWTQRQLAAAAGLHLNSVVYWEKHAVIRNIGPRPPDACWRIEQAFAAAGVVFFARPEVGVRMVRRHNFPTSSRARARASWGANDHEVVPVNVADGDGSDVRHSNPKEVDRTRRVCGAKARRGTPCRAPAMKNGRCKLHGGRSTGARTADGKRRVGLARAKRWQKWRDDHR